MRKKIFTLFLAIIFLFAVLAPNSQATLPTFDAVNAALNELRNALMQSQFAQDIALAAERLSQLREQYFELKRFNSGWDELFQTFIGDPQREILSQARGSVASAFSDFIWIQPEIENFQQSRGPADIRNSLEAITGKIPDSSARPYIPFEELQVVEGFQLAQEIRRSGSETREGARLISEAAKTASPKGAARLQAEALSQVMVLTQQNQEAMAKLLELQATQVEQVSREEKQLEHDRIKTMEDARSYLQSLLAINYQS